MNIQLYKNTSTEMFHVRLKPTCELDAVLLDYKTLPMDTPVYRGVDHALKHDTSSYKNTDTPYGTLGWADYMRLVFHIDTPMIQIVIHYIHDGVPLLLTLPWLTERGILYQTLNDPEFMAYYSVSKNNYNRKCAEEELMTFAVIRNICGLMDEATGAQFETAMLSALRLDKITEIMESEK
jgi:hypothetical protein